jgi:hypothetical protein
LCDAGNNKNAFARDDLVDLKDLGDVPELIDL